MWQIKLKLQKIKEKQDLEYKIMADYLMDIVYYYPYKAYDIIRDIIGFVLAKNKENELR